ncbi:AAA family ATPase [Candidatus Saccharibacteria bacterium]|nr:AAA family ATPase [Candidatus Saccharibacteria bacterium]
MAYSLSPDQAEALRQIGVWYRTRATPYITLGGYAGSGKSTLVAYLRLKLREFDDDARVAFCAYTGKATRVLTERLREQKVPRRSDTVSTIHSLIYTTSETASSAPTWTLKDKLERDLIIVDEASMVDEAIWRDLLSFGVPVLAVGDHGQLPPVGSSFNLMADPQLRLERIWRQAEDSPIIEVATLARTSGQLPVRQFGFGVRKLDKSVAETGQNVGEMLENWRPDLLVLCGYNHTRIKLNQAIRQATGAEVVEPQPGDRVVCLSNNRASKIYNGMLGTLTSIGPATNDPGQLWYEAEIELDGEDYRYQGVLLRAQFGATETARDVAVMPTGLRPDLWDFGYALTVHKAQGSQSPKVLVFEERSAKMSDDDWRRWLYTAVTRAQEELTVVGVDPEAEGVAP